MSMARYDARYDVLVGSRAAKQLARLHPPNRRRALWMRLMAFAGRRPPDGLAQVAGIGDDVALCEVLSERRVVLVYAFAGWRELRERLYGPALVERLRREEFARLRRGRTHGRPV